MNCPHCGDNVYRVTCKICDKEINECLECHNEIVHAKIEAHDISSEYASGGSMTVGGQASLNKKGPAKMKL